MSGWQAGVASRRFDVPPGTALGGYADRTGPSLGTSDDYPLTITALTLSTGSSVVTIVSADVIGVDTRLRGDVAARADVEAESLLIAATHTHSGPEGVLDRLNPASQPTVDPVLRDRLADLIAEVVTASRSSAFDAHLSFHVASCPGLWSNRNRPDGPTDPRVRILRIDAIDGSTPVLVIVLPTHPTILPATNRLVSSDLHGGVRSALAGVPEWSNAPVLMLTGAAGDSSTRRHRREPTFAEVERIGHEVARSVRTALEGSGTPIPPTLSHAARDLALPIRQVDVDRVQRELSEAVAQEQDILSDPAMSEADRRSAHTRVQGAEIQMRMGALAPIRMPLEAWRLGDCLDLVAVPGELFTSLGLQVESGSTRATWVIGYANGYLGYVPDAEAYEAATYEALASPYASEAGDQVVQALLDLLQSLR